MKKILMSALMMGTMSIGANAACNTDACVGKIETLYMTAGGIMYVGTDGDESQLACGGVSGVYMSLTEGHVGKNAMYSLLLTAKTTNKTVSIRVADDADCTVAYVATVD